MSSGPFGPTPDAPPPFPPADEGAQLPEPPHQPPPYALPQMPPATAYPPPPAEPPMGMTAPGPMVTTAAPAPKKRGLGALIAIFAVVLVALVSVGGYVLVGNSYASGKIGAARDAYNSAAGHEAALDQIFSQVTGDLASFIDPTASSISTAQQAKSSFQQLADQATSVQPQIATDDSALAGAESGLKQNSWLTAFSRSSLDRWSLKIDHERAALALATTLSVDIAQWSGFWVAYTTSLVDLDNISSVTSSTSATTVMSYLQAFKTDTAKAKSLDTAPGLPTEIDSLLADSLTLANDFVTYVNDVVNGNSGAVQIDKANVQSDISNLSAFDFSNMANEMRRFYEPLVSQFTAEVSQAKSA